MYTRFFRWASDRIDENGIVAFVTNRSFIEKGTFDGFRETVGEEFSEIWVVDLGGDVRDDPRLSGTRNNVFGIQTGVAISFLVKRAKARGCRIHYAHRPQLETAEEKLGFLANTSFSAVDFEDVELNPSNDWINHPVNDFSAFLPIADKLTKSVKVASQERAMFRLYSLGVSTNRDDWIIGHDALSLAQKMTFFVEHFKNILGGKETDQIIKWSETLTRRFLKSPR